MINAAVTGYQPIQHLVDANETQVEYEPDLIVFLDGHNDFYGAREEFNVWRDYPYGTNVATDFVNEPTWFFTVYMSPRNSRSIVTSAKSPSTCCTDGGRRSWQRPRHDHQARRFRRKH